MQSWLKETSSHQLDQSICSKQGLKLLFDYSPDALIVTDEYGKLLMINKKAQTLFGYSNLDAMGMNIQQFIPQLSSCTLKNSDSMDLQGVSKTGEFCNLKVNSEFIRISKFEVNLLSIREPLLNFKGQNALLRINDQLKKRNRELENLSNTDPLCGILNRRGLAEVLKRELSYADRNHTSLLAALIDLDDFKGINDTLGHAAGDTVLKQVTGIFKDNIRTIDWVARVGGDEFLLLLPCTTINGGLLITERIRRYLINNAIESNGFLVHVSASIAIVSLSHKVNSIEDVLELSKVPLKHCKRSGKNCIAINNIDIGGMSSNLQP